jgi:hypothetical protein
LTAAEATATVGKKEDQVAAHWKRSLHGTGRTKAVNPAGSTDRFVENCLQLGTPPRRGRTEALVSDRSGGGACPQLRTGLKNTGKMVNFNLPSGIMVAVPWAPRARDGKGSSFAIPNQASDFADSRRFPRAVERVEAELAESPWCVQKDLSGKWEVKKSERCR